MNECNSVEYVHLTYYQRNRDVMLNRAKDYYENDKERLRENKIKKENMGKIDTAICLKKKNKDEKNIKKIITRQKKVSI